MHRKPHTYTAIILVLYECTQTHTHTVTHVSLKVSAAHRVGVVSQVHTSCHTLHVCVAMMILCNWSVWQRPNVKFICSISTSFVNHSVDLWRQCMLGSRLDGWFSVWLFMTVPSRWCENCDLLRSLLLKINHLFTEVPVSLTAKVSL